MNKELKTILLLLTLITLSGMANAQGMKIGEVIMVSNSTLKKDVKPEAFQNWVNKEIAPAWNKKYPGTGMHLFRADRGDRKEEFLLVSGAARVADRETLPLGSPFAEKVITTNASSKKSSDFLNNPGAYTEYRLIGADKLKSLPVAGILGIHYIKVKPERSKEFEKFVNEKLHPAVGQLFPDMQLLYYKAVAGDPDPSLTQDYRDAGEYITIFTIESEASRDKYWPAGAPETEILKKTFLPLKELALELGTYLVDDSYLKTESGGAAAYFESTRWTDFIYIKP
jgi:hypothetical protein